MSLPIEKNSTIPTTSRLIIFGVTLAILLLPVLIYMPGLSGPFIFDDKANIVDNKNIQINQLSLTTINEAAHSLSSGALGRPLAGISFAINYYLAGGLTHTFGYKVFNLIVHIINGFLIFWVVSLIIAQLPGRSVFPTETANNKKNILIFAGLCAIIWVIHPIQLTSVLYVVQRMTSMAALFIMLSIIAYIYARNALNRRENYRALSYFSAAALSAVTSAACKETALLLPLYLGLIEFSLFYSQPPWSHWQRLPRLWRTYLLSGLIIVFILIVFFVIEFSLPRYANRDFTMFERILTETRILLFYLGQIFVPRLSSFGIYHDDIAVSTSLFSPWTTLPSVIVIIGILFSAFHYRRKLPLLAFAILWFFSSHAIESTVYPLELIHEHRNYLASLGPILLIVYGLLSIIWRLQTKLIWAVIPLIVLSLVMTTTVRSMQWADSLNLLEAETNYHPDSPRAWGDLYTTQIKSNMPVEALKSLQNAIRLRPKNPGYYLTLYIYAKAFDANLATNAYNNLLMHIADDPESYTLVSQLQSINKCLDTTCKDLQKDFGIWVTEAMKYSNSPRYKYYMACYLYARHDFNASLQFLNQSIKDGQSKHASPFIKRIQVLLALKKFDAAKTAYSDLQKLNKKKLFIRSSYMKEIQRVIIESEQRLHQLQLHHQL